jgi:DNA recombination-dependent growth factor C
MGALRGSLSYLRFLVDGEMAENPGATYEKALEARRFMPLNPAADTMDSAGWVPLEAPFDDEMPIGRQSFLFGETIAVTYREDKYSIPRPLLQRETKKKLAQILQEEKKDPESLTKGFIKAVEQSVLVELKSKTLPRTKLVDVIWDTNKKQARVFGRGTVATERIASLFERTFQVRIELGSYAARAFELDIGSRAHGVLEKLSPGWLFPDALKRDPSEPGSGEELS